MKCILRTDCFDTTPERIIDLPIDKLYGPIIRVPIKKYGRVYVKEFKIIGFYDYSIIDRIPIIEEII